MRFDVALLSLDSIPRSGPRKMLHRVFDDVRVILPNAEIEQRTQKIRMARLARAGLAFPSSACRSATLSFVMERSGRSCPCASQRSTTVHAVPVVPQRVRLESFPGFKEVLKRFSERRAPDPIAASLLDRIDAALHVREKGKCSLPRLLRREGTMLANGGPNGLAFDLPFGKVSLVAGTDPQSKACEIAVPIKRLAGRRERDYDRQLSL